MSQIKVKNTFATVAKIFEELFCPDSIDDIMGPLTLTQLEKCKSEENDPNEDSDYEYVDEPKFDDEDCVLC